MARSSHGHSCLPNVNSPFFRMLLCFPLFSIYACILVNAVRLDEDIDALNGILVASADASADLTDALETNVVHYLIPENASVGEQLSAGEMQSGLLDALRTAGRTRWKEIYPVFTAANQKYLKFLQNAWRRRKKSTSCQRQLGGLLEELGQACQRVISKWNAKSLKYFDGFQKSCLESVEDVFLYGTDVVQALEVGRGWAGKAPGVTEPLLDAGNFLKKWVIKLATAEKAAILWAGFWTNVNLV